MYVVFIGHVQGVGFRHHTRRIASAYPICGWVGNESDGTVKMVAQGDKSILDRLLTDIESYFSDNIHGKKVKYQTPTKEYLGFQIVY